MSIFDKSREENKKQAGELYQDYTEAIIPLPQLYLEPHPTNSNLLWNRKRGEFYHISGNGFLVRLIQLNIGTHNVQKAKDL